MNENTEIEKDPKNVLMLLSLYVAMYFLIIIFPYIIFGFKIESGLVSMPDLIDLVFYPPVFGVLLFVIYESVKSDNQPKYIKYIAFIMLVIHFEGHGLHWAANAIDVLVYGNSSIPKEIADFAYFLDEILSHKIMFGGILGFFFVLFVIDIRYNKYKKYNPVWGLLGIVQGLLFTISFIEGQFIIDAMIIVAVFLVSMFVIHGKDILKARDKPMCWFVLLFLISMYIWAILYVLIFGGLYQPSEFL
ncbi:MAG: hypothetical protein Q6363_000585 [Candidatus Njordarchaeota archaeon]